MHRGQFRWLVVGAVALVLIAAGCGSGGRVAQGVAAFTTLPAPTTTTSTTSTVPGCPATTESVDPTPTVLASPTSWNLPYAATPGGPAIGRVTEHWGGPSTRPVLAEQGGWVQIRLESRPNGSAGWVPAQDFTMSTTPFSIVISICQRNLTLYQSGLPVYSSPVGVGQARWPTPLGSSFIDSVVNTPARQQYIYGPTVFILGSHSNVFTDFDGGDGTVAIHGYPSDPGSTRGVASSHGCVRSSPTTINTLKVVPVGTPVTIVA